jgi:hypothetical protein
MLRNVIVRSKSITKIIKKIAIKRIMTKLYIKN